MPLDLRSELELVQARAEEHEREACGAESDVGRHLHGIERAGLVDVFRLDHLPRSTPKHDLRGADGRSG